MRLIKISVFSHHILVFNLVYKTKQIETANYYIGYFFKIHKKEVTKI